MSKTKTPRGRGGRPSNHQRWQDQQAQIDQLRQLVIRRRLDDDTWKLVNRLLTLIADLEEGSSPIQSTVWDRGVGHSVEQPLLPGVRLADDGGGDGTTNKGNRTLYHGGTYAIQLNAWVHRHLTWVVNTAEAQFKGKEPDPEPRPLKGAKRR
jgi:hypothetical protein